MMMCKHHESHITFGIERNGQTKKWEHTSLQAHRQTTTYRPALSSPIKMLVMLYRTSEMRK